MTLWKRADAPLLLLSVKSCHAALLGLFLILSVISTAFAVCIPKKIHRISVSCYVPLSLSVEIPFLLHANTILLPYYLIKCLERDVSDEQYAVSLYMVYLRTELDRLCFLVSYDGAHIITVNAGVRSLTFQPSNSAFSPTRTFLMYYEFDISRANRLT